MIIGVKRDENDALIRLADSICGFVRDFLEHHDNRLHALYNAATKKKVIIEV